MKLITTVAISHFIFELPFDSFDELCNAGEEENSLIVLINSSFRFILFSLSLPSYSRQTSLCISCSVVWSSGSPQCSQSHFTSVLFSYSNLLYPRALYENGSSFNFFPGIDSTTLYPGSFNTFEYGMWNELIAASQYKIDSSSPYSIFCLRLSLINALVAIAAFSKCGR